MTLRFFPALLLGAAVAAFALLGIAMAVNHFIAEPYNPGFARHPLMVQGHAALGGVYLALGAFQFVPAIRRRAIGAHRWNGRFLAAIALFVGASAIFIGAVIPFSGPPETVVISIFGAVYLYAIVAGVAAARGGRIDRHRAWMIRAYAVGSAVVTMRLIFIPSLMFLAPVSDLGASELSIIAFSLAFVIHTLTVELWLRHTARAGALEA